jgi:O-antigen/teichoic acid export membrane protein
VTEGIGGREAPAVTGSAPVLPGVPVPASAPVLEPLGAGRRVRPAPSLGSKIRAGASWSMLNSVVTRIGNFTVGAVLARAVFGPRIFGLYAISQAVLVLLLSANELGVCAAIIRWDTDVRRLARTVLTLSVAWSTAIYACLYPVAPAIASALGSRDATDVVRVICICVIIDGFAGVPAALLTREFAQGRRMLVDLANFVVSSGVTLWLAFAGHGAMSFAWGTLSGCMASLLVANGLAAPIVRPGWRSADARELIRFGLPLAGASLLLLAVFNVDSMIVGATLGAAMLGLYQLAFNISSWPVVGIAQTAARVSFAGFSRLADGREMLSAAFTRAMSVLMAVTLPPCILLATLSYPLIHTIYGPRWTPAAPVLRLLAVLGILRVGYALVYDCLAASGYRHALMWIQAAWLAALIPAIISGARLHGIVGVGAGHVVVAAVLVGPLFLWALRRLGVSGRAVLVSCLRPLTGGLLMAPVSLLMIRIVGGSATGLAVAIVVSLAVYAPIVYPMRASLRQPLPERAAEVDRMKPA